MLDKNDFMKKIILFLLLPLVIFSQETILVGDVDCNGEVNSEDASLILQYVTSVIDSLPCSENMSGLTPDQLQEIVEMMDSQLIINYGGMSFGDWVLKYDNPNFDNFLYGQEETDGFLLVQYNRENQITSSASFGFNIHTGSDIDTVNFNMDVSINVHTSWNPVNSKTIPIKKGDYWVLENFDDWTVEVSIDKVYFLPINGESSVNDDSSSGGNATASNKSVEFPDGCCGEPVSWSLENFGDYTVPDGKNLYITQYHNTEQSNGLFITSSDPDYPDWQEQCQIIKGHSNYVYYTGVGFSPSNTNGMPIIVGGGDLVSGDGSFNGFIIDAIVTPFTTIEISDGCYAENQDACYIYDNDGDENVFILQFYGDGSGALGVDVGSVNVLDYSNYVPIIENYSNNIFYTGVGYTPAMTLSSPIMVGPNQLIMGKGTINGYITPLNYFSE